MFYDVGEIYASTPRDGAELLATPMDLEDVREVFCEWAWLIDLTRRLLGGPLGGEAAGRQARAVCGSNTSPCTHPVSLWGWRLSVRRRETGWRTSVR